ncbi:MAG: VCBS repeat-containing protein [bacterium]
MSMSRMLLLFIVVLTGTPYCQTFDSHELTPGPQVTLGCIAGAIFSYPVAGDFDGDGQIDLIVPTIHAGVGTRFYKGVPDVGGNRTFEAGVHLTLPSNTMTGVDWNGDGLTDILVRDQPISLFLCQGGTPPSFSGPQSLWANSAAPSDVSADYFNASRHGDFVDLVVGKTRFQDQWSRGGSYREGNLSLWQGYDASGKWRGEERLGFLERFRFPQDLTKNRSVTGILLTGKIAPLAAHLNISPIAIDADSDGDHDMLYADFVGNLFYAENVNTDCQPVYEDPITLFDSEGNRLRAPQCMVRGHAVDWNGDGVQDFVFGTEDSFIYVCLNKGKGSRFPVFAPPFRVLQENPPMDLGVAAIPNACDLDADGNTDLVVGNAAGEIYLIPNEGSNSKPAFGQPKRLEIDGTIFRLIAGYNGSPQGPGEASWGYIAPSVADVDSDGDIDILYCSVDGYHSCILNIGNAKTPKWSKPTPIQTQGKHMRTVWRTRPIMTDWNENGVLDYICLNEHGEVGIFPGSKDRSWNALDGWQPWKLTDGKIIDPDGKSGMEGRCKIALTDWDNDGKKDLLIGVKGGTPWAEAYGRNKRSYVLFLKGVEGGNAAVFDKPRVFRQASGEDIVLGDHTASPEIVSLFGDQEPGLLIGGENGRLYYYSRKDLSW